MLLAKLSNLQFLETAGTSLTVADTLSRDFLSITKKMCQLQHKTLPTHIEFNQLKPKNSLEQIHYLVKNEESLANTKNYSYPILVEYGDDKFTIRIQDKGNTVTYTSLDSFSFQSLPFFLNKYKKPAKIKINIAPTRHPCSDPGTKRMMTVLLRGFRNKNQNHFNCLILFILASVKFNANILTTLFFLKTS